MFELNKVQLTKYGGLEISYTKCDGTVAQGEQDNPVEYKIKSIAAPHPDLVRAITELDVIVAECFELVDDQMVLDRIKVKGVEYAVGNSIIIHWEWIAKNNVATKMITPRIKLESDIFGFEKDLSDMVQRIHEETYSYIKGKRAQLSLFSADGEPGENDSEDAYNEAIAELENEE